MKNLIWKLFGFPETFKPINASVAVQVATEPVSGDDPLTIEDGSDNAMRRQLVHVLLRDLLRKHGIAPHWIELQMLVVARSRRGTGLYVRLIVRHWDERLMNYASALQNALLAEIARFEPHATDWLHGISWQFEMTESCPYPTLPDKAFWKEPAKSLVPAALTKTVMPVILAEPPLSAFDSLAFAPTCPAFPHAAENEAMEDVQQLFQVRDQVLGKLPQAIAVGYEKTQPQPLAI
jgi:hypothetical protein